MVGLDVDSHSDSVHRGTAYSCSRTLFLLVLWLIPYRMVRNAVYISFTASGIHLLNETSLLLFLNDSSIHP